MVALAASMLLSACMTITSRETTGETEPVISEQPAVTVDPEPEPPVFDTPLLDGRHAAYLESVDGDAVVFDPIAFVTGKSARDIYAAEHPDDGGGPPNDYLIVNLSTERWQVPLASDAGVQIVELSSGGPVELVDATVDQLSSHVAELPAPTPFWLQVRDGVVTAIEEQYLP